MEFDCVTDANLPATIAQHTYATRPGSGSYPKLPIHLAYLSSLFRIHASSSAFLSTACRRLIAAITSRLRWSSLMPYRRRAASSRGAPSAGRLSAAVISGLPRVLRSSELSASRWRFSASRRRFASRSWSAPFLTSRRFRSSLAFWSRCCWRAFSRP